MELHMCDNHTIVLPVNTTHWCGVPASGAVQHTTVCHDYVCVTAQHTLVTS